MSTENTTGDWSQVSQNPTDTEIQAPKRYQVWMLNDDTTPMDFVVQVLMQYFSMDEERAVGTMLAVHNNGKAVCGTFTKDVAETKVLQVTQLARSSGYPLRCQVEAVD